MADDIGYAEQNYWAPDREEYLANMRNQGKAQYEQAAGPAPSFQQQSIGPSPEWNREKFRDAWMGSGVQNVGGMQDWLKNTGWGQHVAQGGKKGDMLYLPTGERIDAILAAGRGGQGATWTGKGSWSGQGGSGTGYSKYQGPIWQGQQQQQSIAPSWGGGNWGGYNPWMQGGGWGMMQQPQGNPQTMQQNQMHQQYQNQQKMRHPGIGPRNPYQMRQQQQRVQYY